MSAKGDEREDSIAETGPVTLVKINPAVAEASLFTKLSVQLSPELVQEIKQGKSELLPPERIIVKYPNQVALMIHTLMRHNTSSVLGQIIPPSMGRTIIIDRISQAATVLLDEYREHVEKVTNKILEKKLRGEDFEEEIRSLVEMQKLIMIALREITNRLAVLYAINLPVRARPPLANVKMGYEAIPR